MAIVSPKKVLYKKLYGVKKINNDKKRNNEKVNERTIYRIASLSKQFSAIAALIAEQQNLINLNDCIEKYIPHIIIGNKKHTKKIKIVNVITHTTGALAYSFETVAYKKQSSDKLFATLKNTPIISRPGTTFQYQNVIFSLIKPIINAACNKTLDKIIKEEILDKLNMTDTLLTSLKYNQCVNKAHPHIRTKDKARKFYNVNIDEYYDTILPAAGLSSNLTDMIKWLQFLIKHNEIILEHKFFKKLFLPIADANKKMKCKNKNCKTCKLKTYYYGLGLYMRDYNGERVVFHGGALTGFRSMIAFSPKHQVGIVVLCNANHRLPFFTTKLFFQCLSKKYININDFLKNQKKCKNWF